jgi:modulator of FtsH protease
MLALMLFPNDPAAWQDFYVMMGGANAALTGLVFVALSIHLKEVLEHPLLRPRAVIALTVLTTQIVIAAIVLTPQDSTWMGVEIFVLNASFLIVDLRQRGRGAFNVNRASLLSFAIRLVYIYSALSLFFGVGGGFYVLAFIVLLTLARTMASAWALLTALE